MAKTPLSSQKRIEFTPQADDHALIQRAARLRGLSIAAFVTSTVISEAREVIRRLGEDDQRQFQYALVLRALNFSDSRGTSEDVAVHTGLPREIVECCLTELELMGRIAPARGHTKAVLWKVVKK
ncbi:MAG TPA: DUF1778 domain-containing protein [Blastocatellia bacterium]|nr:DUF1778 domain-containing protein [Blastocatellia bacterium]